MILRIKKWKLSEDSIFIEANSVVTSWGSTVRAVFDGSNENFLQMVVATIFGYISDSIEGENTDAKNIINPRPDDREHYVFNTKFGGINIGPIGNGMYEIFIEDLSHEDCNLEIYVNDHRIS